MADRKYYVLCERNCKFESLTKEQIFAAIVEATGNAPTGIDSAFITKIKEQNKNKDTLIWTGTKAEYNALVANGDKDPNTVYIVSTDGGILIDTDATNTLSRDEVESLIADKPDRKEVGEMIEDAQAETEESITTETDTKLAAIHNEIPKIEFGSYAGAAKSSEVGSDYSVSLTFSFTPVFFAIYATSGETMSVPNFFHWGASGYRDIVADNGEDATDYSEIRMNFDGNTVTWYIKADETNAKSENAFNRSGRTYYYFAIG